MEKEKIKFSEYKSYVEEIGESLKKKQYDYCKLLQGDLLNLLKEDERKQKKEV